MSVASELAAAIATRISEIRTSNGYSTNIGQTVFRGRATLVEENLPAAVLVEGDDKVLDAASHGNMPASLKSSMVKLSQRYIVEGHTVCDPDNPNDAAHLILADLKKAIFKGDKTFGGVVKTLTYVGRNIGRREDGASLIAASVVFDAQFVEDLANP